MIGCFLGGMFFCVGALFVLAFWQEDARGPLWVGWGLAALGACLLAAKRTIEIDPTRRRVLVRRSWLFFSSLAETDFGSFAGVAIARTHGSTPSYGVQLLADTTISLPSQGRNPRGAGDRAREIAHLLGVPVEDEKRRVSSLPMV